MGRALLLEVRELKASYRSELGPVRAVDGVSLSVEPGESLGLVGESGCGKSTLVKCIIKVFPRALDIEAGEILFRGRDLLPLGDREMRSLRWKDISLIPQSAMNSLNPVYPVGFQVREAILAHERVTRSEASERVKEVLTWVGIDPRRAEQYPHQFSGGMRQRVNIALALALEPALVVADEPTTALDVVVQDQIFHKIQLVRARTGASLLLVTHDISLVAENCDKMAVMYAGKIVEAAEVSRVIHHPVHPYTLGLKNAFPDLERAGHRALISIPKAPPSLVNPPTGCRFTERCPFATEVCRAEEPPLEEVEKGHFAACHHAREAEEMRRQAQRAETWTVRS